MRPVLNGCPFVPFLSGFSFHYPVHSKLWGAGDLPKASTLFLVTVTTSLLFGRREIRFTHVRFTHPGAWSRPGSRIIFSFILLMYLWRWRMAPHARCCTSTLGRKACTLQGFTFKQDVDRVWEKRHECRLDNKGA